MLRKVRIVMEIIELPITIEESENYRKITNRLKILGAIGWVKAGEPNVIKKVGGKSETKKFLENLGFVVGGLVTVISEINGSLIVNVKDSRVAIGKDMANKILV